ncbi:hypothetical protein [Nocardia farcinica]|nr:hypothetical protein [Nocardia farcinica]
MIWQLADGAQLLVGWRPVTDPAAVESDMLAAFLTLHHRLPFANRRR